MLLNSCTQKSGYTLGAESGCG
uniref:Uncharacterized protein n=1 Tax=Anguilla anguilla TaxID=7936 RepID=A0A0E9UAS1_ANGAN